MSKEAMKLALARLQARTDTADLNAIAALNEALAEQPAQQQEPWVGLTDEEIERVCIPLGAAMLSFTEVARAIEAKLKEKNT